MPENTPVLSAGSVSSVEKNKTPILGSRLFFGRRRYSVLSASLFFGTSFVASDVAANTLSLIDRPGSAEILEFAVFGGAMSFAILSAFWLIRQRGSLLEEIKELRHTVTDLKAKNDRTKILTEVPGQRLAVWSGEDVEAELMGELVGSSGAPKSSEKFLAFGSWLEADSAEQFKIHLDALKSDAKPFTLTLRTKADSILEAVGLTSGAAAVVRFVDLDGKMEELAEVRDEHVRLQSVFARVEALLQKLPMPIWLRNKNDELAWANYAYSDAVEAEGPIAAVDRNANLFDAEQRRTIKQSRDGAELFNKSLPAIVAGDRKMLDVFNIWTEEGSAGLAIDQSKSDDIERTLLETKEGHSRMLDQLATAVAIFDKSQHLTFCNSGFRQLWNLDDAFLETSPSNAQLLDTMRDGELLPAHPDWKKWRDGQLEIYQALEPREEWWHLLDGQTLRVVVSPRSEGGANWIFENVTERLALESNYNSLIQMQGETLDHLNEAVAVFGSDGKLKLFNPALEELWQSDDLVVEEGLHVSKVVECWSAGFTSPTQMKEVLGKITGFEDGRKDARGRIQLNDGKSLNYAVVPLPKGQSMLTLADVTDSVNIEKALQERAEAFEESDRLKTNFIQHVSYELRAPLTSISGFAELMESKEIGPLNDKQHEYLEHINSASSALRSLVDDILDLASLDAGRLTLTIGETIFADCMEQVSKSVDSELSRKSVSLSWDSSSGAEVISADSDRLQQILTHLVSNAIRFSPDGGVVSVATSIEEGSYCIRVNDDGPGIAPDEKEKIFDRFEARSATGTRHGAGLGLSLVKGLVTLHGGEVEIEENEARKGTCILLRLPIKGVADGQSNAAATA